MPMIQDIAVAVGLAKSIRELLGQVGQAKVKSQLQAHILELQGVLLDLQPKMLEVQQENADLKRALQDKDDITAFKSECELRRGVYYKKGDESQAFCGACLDKSNKIIALSPPPGSLRMRQMVKFLCPACQATYGR